jgi:hypothetical protein
MVLTDPAETYFRNQIRVDNSPWFQTQSAKGYIFVLNKNTRKMVYEC